MSDGPSLIKQEHHRLRELNLAIHENKIHPKPPFPPPYTTPQYAVWLTATRTLKLLPHLWYRPQDIIYIPAWILFGYYL